MTRRKGINDMILMSNDTAFVLGPFCGIAGERWNANSKSKVSNLYCSKCGRQISLSCPGCRNTILTWQYIISGFIINAHAHTQAELLLSRDRGFYKKYFKDLRIE